MALSGSIGPEPGESMLESVEDHLLKFNLNEIRTGRELAVQCWEAGFHAAKMRSYRWIKNHRCDNRWCMSEGILSMNPDESEHDDEL